MQEGISTTQSREDFWRTHSAAWEESGLSQKEYCRQHGLSKSALGWWRTRLARKAAGGVTLVPVPFLKSAVRHGRLSSGLTLVVGDHYRIEVADDFHAVTLTRLLTTLE